MIYLPYTDVQGKQGVYHSEDQNMYLSLDEVPQRSYQASVCSLWGCWRWKVWLQQLLSLLGIKNKSPFFRSVAVDTGVLGDHHYGQIGSLVVRN